MALSLESGQRRSNTRPRTRAPRIAEVVAAALRDEILSGELTELPRLEDLIERFDVGLPAAREAMRILDTEGLVTVRRGNIGGATVHLPTSDRVAYMMSLVLQSHATDVGDVGEALRQLEPLCAALCASRPDREMTVVPQLRQLMVEQGEALGDALRTREVIDRFHFAIINGCGNDTLVLAVGALQRIWAAHAEAVYASENYHEPIDSALWRASLRDHERMLRAIERGDQKVASLARAHLEASQTYMSGLDADRKVTAATTAELS